MINTRRFRLATLIAINLALISVNTACEGRGQREAANGSGAEVTLRPMDLPNLDGLAAAVQEQFQSQYDRLQAVAELNSSDRASLSEAYGMMGQLLLAYGLDDAAETALLNAADLQSADVRWLYYLGYLNKNQGEFEAAARRFEGVLELTEKDLPARIHLAEAYIELRREAEARELLEYVLLEDAENAAAHFLLGDIARAEDPAAAVDHYTAVLKLQPDASVVHYPLALAYRDLGDSARSNEHIAARGEVEIAVNDPLLQTLQLLRIGADAKMMQGTQLMNQRMFREAAAVFESIVAEDSTSLPAYLNLGVAYAQAGEPQKAMEALESVLRLDPSNSRAHHNLGLLFLGRGERARAAEHFRAAVDGDPSNTAAHFALAKYYWRERRCSEAIPHFQVYLNGNPSDVEARINQAICQVQLGEDAEALMELEDGFEAFPDRLELQDAIVRVLAAGSDGGVRDGERAVLMAERLVARVKRPETFESLAMAYAEVGRFDGAIQLQRQVIEAAERQGLSAMVDYLRGNLRRYENRQPCRTPWPPIVFDM